MLNRYIVVCPQYNLLDLIKKLCKLSKHTYFCEIVYLELLYKTIDLAKVIGLKVINKDNFAFKYQLNKDKFPCSCVSNF